MTSQATISSHVRHVDASPALMRELGAFFALYGAAHFAGTRTCSPSAPMAGPSTTSPALRPALIQ